MMDMFAMEEFIALGDGWAPEQTYAVNHFDDLKVTEAQDGLQEFRIKSKPLDDPQVDVLHDLLDSSQEGNAACLEPECPLVFSNIY